MLKQDPVCVMNTKTVALGRLGEYVTVLVISNRYFMISNLFEWVCR